MDKGLSEAYELVCEKSKRKEGFSGKGVVSSHLKKGETIMGSLKKAKGRMGPEFADRAKNIKNKKIKRTVNKEEYDMALGSNFDSLFKDHLLSEEDLTRDDSPLEMEGETEFDDDAGDFPAEDGSEDNTNEEVDVATELRLIIDRLTEIAEKIGSYDEELDVKNDFEDDDSGDNDFENEEGAGIDVPMRESFTKKSNDKIKNILRAKHRKAKLAAIGKGRDGVMRAAKKSCFNPNMDMKAKTNSVMGRKGAMIFDD